MLFVEIDENSAYGDGIEGWFTAFMYWAVFAYFYYYTKNQASSSELAWFFVPLGYRTLFIFALERLFKITFQ